MPSFPGGCTTIKQFYNYVHERVRECILRYMSKEETAIHLRDRYQIPYGCTDQAWRNIEGRSPEFFRTYFENGAPNATALARKAKQNALAQIIGETGSYSPPKGESDKASRLFTNTRTREQEKQLREFVRKILSKVPDEAAATNAHDGNPIVSVEKNSSAAGQSQALQKQTLQTSQQQPVLPTAGFWQKLSITLDRIQSNSDQMVKLMTDGHGFAPHPSAVGSSKRQRVEPEKERGDNVEADKLQDQNVQLPQQTNGQSRGNKAAKIQ